MYLPLRRSFPDSPPRSFCTSSLKISKKELYMPTDSTRMSFCFSGGEESWNVQFFRRVTHDQLVIRLTDGVRVYRVNKRMMMLPWHKSNLKALTYKSPVYYNQC